MVASFWRVAQLSLRGHVMTVRLAPLLLLIPLATSAAVTATPQSASPVSVLHALFDAAWQRDLREDPVAASSYGDKRYNALWPDVSLAEIERRHRDDEATLAALQKIERASLPPNEQLN